MKNSPKKTAGTSAKTASSKTKTSPNRSNGSGGGSAHREDLTKVFEDTLKDIYWAEKHLTKALPKMSKAAYDENLRAAFNEHLQQTEEQVERLDQVFEQLGKKAIGKKCPAMEGLVEEGKEAIDEYDPGYARDAALIISAQKIEHYEIAAYGSLKAHAQMMGEEEVASLLDQTLQEESETDEKLTELSGNINQQAYLEGGEAEGLEDTEEDTEDIEDEEIK
jgi:ferritin-like metal-binding protein YciE